jgi:hypothetical protein
MLSGFTDTVSESGQHLVARPSGFTNPYAALPSFHAGTLAQRRSSRQGARGSATASRAASADASSGMRCDARSASTRAA